MILSGPYVDMMRLITHHRKTELGIADASWSWGRPLQGAGSFQGPSQDSQVTKNTMSLL